MYDETKVKEWFYAISAIIQAPEGLPTTTYKELCIIDSKGKKHMAQLHLLHQVSPSEKERQEIKIEARAPIWPEGEDPEKLEMYVVTKVSKEILVPSKMIKHETPEKEAPAD